MTDEKKKRKPLGLQIASVPETPGTEQIRQSLSHGRSKSVTVEVKRKRRSGGAEGLRDSSSRLTDQEQTLRMQVVQEAIEHQQREQEQLRLREEQAQKEAQQAQEARRVAELNDQIRQAEQEQLRQRNVAHESSERQRAAAIQEAPRPVAPRPAAVGPEGTDRAREASFVAEATARRRTAYEERQTESEKEVRKPDFGRKAPPKKRDRGGRVGTFQEDGPGDDGHRQSVGLKKLRKYSGRGRAAAATANRLPAVQRTVMLKTRMQVSEVAQHLAEKVPLVLRALNRLGVSATADSWLDTDTVQLLVQERGGVSKDTNLVDRQELLMTVETPNLAPRPPVVTVMGHVDHGKTSLLDALRKTDVVRGEAGGITQHIGAYQVRMPSGKAITFIDTPGHKAFTHMRARGARATDIVILVVAADDGINEQTIEAIRHCQSAGVPMIVAINKIDKPGCRPDHVRNQLLSYDIVVERLGGNVQDVEVSALKAINLDQLEEAVLLQAEIMELTADPTVRAKGVVLETRMKKGQGSVATVLVQEGTLSKGDVFVVGNTWGRVRLLFDDKGLGTTKAGPSVPVEIVGFDELPESGDILVGVSSEAEAKDFIDWKKGQDAQKQDAVQVTPFSLSEHFKTVHVNEQPLILKADAQGSIEGMVHELDKIRHSEVATKVIHKAVGPVNEGDVLLAKATGAMIIGFNVPVLPEARKLIEQGGVRLLSHRIIYQVVDEIKEILSGMLATVYEEQFLGRAEVVQVFHVKKSATIAGCLIKEGLIRRGEGMRVRRGNKVVFEGQVKSLRHLKDDVREKSAGYECGITTDGYSDFQIGDSLECFTKKVVERSV
jgi:translation initiation factor IF-2